MSTTLQRLQSSIDSREARLRSLEAEVIRKGAYLSGLPNVEVGELQEPAIRFVRLSDPKREGQSLKKKQCDLWEFCWGSSSLHAYVVVNSLDWTAKSSLELGGGLGISTLALAKAYSTKRSVMTDLVADALKVFMLSTTLQKLKGNTNTRVLNWNQPDIQPEDSSAFDLVMGSDVLFMSWCAIPVANVAAKSLSDSGLVMIVDPYRLNDEAFLHSLAELGIAYQQSYDFPTHLVNRLVLPLLDTRGSVVPVKRAKLLVASKMEIPVSLQDILTSKLGLIPL